VDQGCSEPQWLHHCAGALHLKVGRTCLALLQTVEETRALRWTPEAEAAIQDFMEYLASPPILVAPRPNEPLLLYVAATSQVVSAVLVVEREEDLKLAESRARGCSAQLDPTMPPLEEANQGLAQEQGLRRRSDSWCSALSTLSAQCSGMPGCGILKYKNCS
jgi:hypothetical protein